VPLQKIIGVDKNNPYFTVCKHPEKPGKLMVFFGAALLEIVDEDQDDPAFKLLLARLYNAQVKRKTLVETFGVALSTLRRLGEALSSGDPQRLLRVLAGRRHPRKLTPEILGFAEKRFSHIYPDNPYSYSKQIREEIQATSEVELSAEALRPYFAQWKPLRVADTEPASETGSSGCDANERCSEERGGKPPELGDCAAQADPIEPCGVEDLPRLPVLQTDPPRPCPATAATAQEPGGPESGERIAGHHGALEAHSLGCDGPNRKHALLCATEPGYRFCHHAGILLFSAYFQPLAEGLGEAAALIKQWLAAVLLGASNIEQSKLLDWNALQSLLGDVVVNLRQQRHVLGELARTGVLESLLRFNGNWADIEQCRDFYYDPHSKHYTGAQKILKGWCSRLRFAEKVLHMDFIHTVSGAPVYIVHHCCPV
jgi:hypothetical protein